MAQKDINSDERFYIPNKVAGNFSLLKDWFTDAIGLTNLKKDSLREEQERARKLLARRRAEGALER